VVRADALSYLGEDRDRVDLALLDPPYRFGDEAWTRLVAAVDAELAVLESDRAIEVGARWEVLRSKRYGGTVVALARRR
jgi:16S rRNA G966 N2-methylase RsmD